VYDDDCNDDLDTHMFLCNANAIIKNTHLT